MIQHTNGPWRVAYNARVVVALSPSTVVATVAGEERDRIGNARAIAAVPELIAALQGLLQSGAPGSLSWSIAEPAARAALRKAGL